MQRSSRSILIVLSIAVLPVGCQRSTPSTGATVATKAVATPLVLACSDPTLSATLLGRSAGWGAINGRSVVAGTEDAAEVLVVRPTDIGRLAVAGRASSLPPALKDSTNPLQWPRLSPAYRGTLSGWGGETVAVPLAGDSLLLVYRADRIADPKHQAGFQAKYGRPLQPPATWDDLLDVATYFATAEGKPSLPGVPTDPSRLLAEYHALAACLDHRALVDADLKGKTPPPTGFHTDPTTGGHRLGTPAFRAAADWLAKAAPHRSAEADPTVALTSGTAIAAVVTLADLGRMPKDKGGVIDSRIKVRQPPGTRTYFDSKGNSQPASGRAGNYIPFLGAGGWVAVVNAQRPDAASWNLVAELAGSSAVAARTSDPALGAGPVRGDSTPGTWARYGFDPLRNTELATAVRHFLAVEVVNPVFTLRTPDAAARLASLESAVRLAATGKATSEQAIEQAIRAWNQQDQATKPDDLKRWRRNAAGLP